MLLAYLIEIFIHKKKKKLAYVTISTIFKIFYSFKNILKTIFSDRSFTIFLKILFKITFINCSFKFIINKSFLYHCFKIIFYLFFLISKFWENNFTYMHSHKILYIYDK